MAEPFGAGISGRATEEAEVQCGHDICGDPSEAAVRVELRLDIGGGDGNAIEVAGDGHAIQCGLELDVSDRIDGGDRHGLVGIVCAEAIAGNEGDVAGHVVEVVGSEQGG